jgi:hypothetical protein
VFERVADERTEEAEDAEGLGRRSGTGNVDIKFPKSFLELLWIIRIANVKVRQHDYS